MILASSSEVVATSNSVFSAPALRSVDWEAGLPITTRKSIRLARLVSSSDAVSATVTACPAVTRYFARSILTSPYPRIIIYIAKL